MSETLGQKQRRFTRMVALLIEFAYSRGYEMTFGEAFRTKEQAAIYAKAGTGSLNSNHCIRLAVDCNLFKDGEYLTASESYAPLGEYWESIGGAWGGRFKRPDGNHFSLEHEGHK